MTVLALKYFEEQWNVAVRSPAYFTKSMKFWDPNAEIYTNPTYEFNQDALVLHRIEDVLADFKKLRKQWTAYCKHTPELKSTIENYLAKIDEIKKINDKLDAEEDRWLDDEDEVLDRLVRKPGPEVYKNIDQTLALATGKITIADVFREAGLIETGVMQTEPGRQLRIFTSQS